MAKKPIRHKRCIHMPAPENTVVIFTSKNGDEYEAGFTIGNQDFTVGMTHQTKDHAQWFCNALEDAFRKLIHNSLEDKFKSPLGKQAVRDMNTPKIIIINKG